METFELNFKHKLEENLPGFQIEFLKVTQSCFWFKVSNGINCHTLIYDIFERSWFIVNSEKKFKPKACDIHQLVKEINNV